MFFENGAHGFQAELKIPLIPSALKNKLGGSSLFSVKKYVSPVVGALIGAAVVGGVWYGIHATKANPVIAKVGNTSITKTQLLSESEAYAGSQMLQQLITNQLITDEAKKQKITATSKEVNQALKSIEQQNHITSDAQLKKLLAQSHMTKPQLMSQLKTRVLEQKLASNKVNVTQKQIQAFYNKNKQRLATPEQRAISDIIVKSKSQAQQLKQQIAKGKSFATLAKQNSIDTSTKSKGGSMGTLAQATLQQQDPNIASAAFKLKKGQVSSPIKVSKGYELLTVTKIQPSKVPSLKSATSEIKQILTQQNTPSASQLVANIAKTEKISILDKSYAPVKKAIENPPKQQQGGVPSSGQ